MQPLLVSGEDNLYYPSVSPRPAPSLLPASSSLSRSVPGLPAATAHHHAQEPQLARAHDKRWNLR